MNHLQDKKSYIQQQGKENYEKKTNAKTRRKIRESLANFESAMKIFVKSVGNIL